MIQRKQKSNFSRTRLETEQKITTIYGASKPKGIPAAWAAVCGEAKSKELTLRLSNVQTLSEIVSNVSQSNQANVTNR